MRISSCLYFLLLISYFASAQQSGDKIIFLDSLKVEVPEGNHTYYRIVKDYYSDNKPYKFLNYFKSGQLQSEGFTNDKDKLARVGEYIEYYKNGGKRSQYHFDASREIGKYYTWYENGNPESEGECPKLPGDPVKILQYWDCQNNKTVIDGNGYVKGLNSFYGEGVVNNGYRDGEWKSEFNNGIGKIIETYNSGKFISGLRVDEKNGEIRYSEFEKKPNPEKGIKDFYEFVGKNFKVTKAASKENISGKIIITFVVDEQGYIVEPEIKKGLGYGLDEEAIRVLQKYGNWIPGEQRGVKVRCHFSLPISVTASK